jgi:hypothetical protein
LQPKKEDKTLFYEIEKILFQKNFKNESSADGKEN